MTTEKEFDEMLLAIETIPEAEVKLPKVETGLCEVDSRLIKEVIEDYRKLQVICDVKNLRTIDSSGKGSSRRYTSPILFEKSKIVADILNPERTLRSLNDLLEYFFDLLSQKDDYKTIADLSDFSSYSPESVKAMLVKFFPKMDFNTAYYFKYGKSLVFALKSEALGNFVRHRPISEVRKIRVGSIVLEPKIQS